MPKYIVERKVKGMGLSSQSEMQMMAQKSNEALNELEGKVMWLESFVTDDASYCIYVAPNEELIRCQTWRAEKRAMRNLLHSRW